MDLTTATQDIDNPQSLEILRGYTGVNCVPSPASIEALQNTEVKLVSGQFVGAGKSTFIQELENMGGVNLASWTNRDLRPGEVEGRDKCKVSIGQLVTAAENGELLELEEVRQGIFYATPARLSTNRRYVKDLELKGALRLREYAPNLPIIVPVPPLRSAVPGGELSEWERRVVDREGYHKSISDKAIEDLRGRLEGVVEEADRIIDENLIDDPNTVIIVNDYLPDALSAMKTFLKTGEKPHRPEELGGYLRTIQLAGHIHKVKNLASTALV